MSKLLKLSDTHYIIVDDSEIKEGSWVINGNSKIFQYTKESISGINYCKKITHSTEPIERYDHPAGGYEGTFDKIKPLSLSEVEEAINGYSVEKMAKNYGNIFSLEGGHRNYAAQGWLDGFKAHQELMKNKLFSLATVDGCMMSIANWIVKNNITSGTEILTKIGEISESLLLPKTEWDVEFDEQGKIKLL